MENFTFGEKVLVKACLGRVKYDVNEDDQIIPNKNYRRWVRHEYPVPLEAVFLGKRTLADGMVEHDYDDGDYFKAVKYIPGAWICIKGRNPEKVFLSDVEKING